MSTFTWTQDQSEAIKKIITFLADPKQKNFVLSGYAGTGKSTLVRKILDDYDKLMKTVNLIRPNTPHLSIALTATTNKAVEALTEATGFGAMTIYSFLGLRVIKDYETNTTRLVPKKKGEFYSNHLIFVDEASYADKALLTWLDRLTIDCKVIFIGDPAQLINIKEHHAPVFTMGYPEARLEEVVRQKNGNQIIDLATMFRETVSTGKFFSFTPDGVSIRHIPRDQFDQELVQEFSNPNWKHHDSKVLGWTNKCVVNYNRGITGVIKGDPKFQEGDYAISNNFIYHKGSSISFKTDQLVRITHIGPEISDQGLIGREYTVDNLATFFMPNHLSEKKALISTLTQQQDYSALEYIDTHWIDLRAVYACTIDKAQGSTYDRVYIDLDDIRQCNNGNRIARMMYVGVSRARHCVTFTGDFV